MHVLSGVKKTLVFSKFKRHERGMMMHAHGATSEDFVLPSTNSTGIWTTNNMKTTHIDFDA